MSVVEVGVVSEPMLLLISLFLESFWDYLVIVSIDSSGDPIGHA
jgi:hypothetical protein